MVAHSDLHEAILDLLDTIAKGFGLRKKADAERRLRAFPLPDEHDIGLDFEEPAVGYPSMRCSPKSSPIHR